MQIPRRQGKLWDAKVWHDRRLPHGGRKCGHGWKSQRLFGRLTVLGSRKAFVTLGRTEEFVGIAVWYEGGNGFTAVVIVDQIATARWQYASVWKTKWPQGCGVHRIDPESLKLYGSIWRAQTLNRDCALYFFAYLFVCPLASRPRETLWQPARSSAEA